MSTRAIAATGRTLPHRQAAARRTSTNSATLIAVTLFLAVLIAEAAFVVLKAPSIADLGALATLAVSVP